jgi:hypothetical protein
MSAAFSSSSASRSPNELDLDIRNYSVKDLEKLFQLQEGYSVADVEYKESKMREILLSSGYVKKQNKGELIDFLKQASEWLLFVKRGSVKTATALPVEPRLDKTEYVEPTGTSKAELVVKRPTTQYVHTMQSDYYEGTLNPLATRTTKQCLTIDTRFRDNFYTSPSSDFTFQLPLKFAKVVSMQLSSLEIPLSFYGISKAFGNTHLWLEVEYLDTRSPESPAEVSTRTFEIAEGNYNASDFIATLNAVVSPKLATATATDKVVLQDLSDPFSYLQWSLDITETGSGTGKVTLAPIPLADVSGGYVEIARVKMDFTRNVAGQPENTDISSHIGWNLGFTRKIYDGRTQYTADTIIEPATIRYVYLAVDDFNNSANNHFVTAFNRSLLSPNILARISLRGNYFSLLMDNDLNIVTEPRKYFGPVDIQRLRVRLYDDFGRILDMNGANYSFCLTFTSLYDV